MLLQDLSPLLKPLSDSQARQRGCGSEHTTQRVPGRGFSDNRWMEKRDFQMVSGVE